MALMLCLLFIAVCTAVVLLGALLIGSAKQATCCNLPALRQVTERQDVTCCRLSIKQTLVQ